MSTATFRTPAQIYPQHETLTSSGRTHMRIAHMSTQFDIRLNNRITPLSDIMQFNSNINYT